MPDRPRPVDFRARAQVEAERYGPDAWIFVRELLQNARDAGASAAEISVEEEDGQVRITFVDDGEGMSFEHARRYLFALYASSKERAGDQVGRFGVGFWSILRFEPVRITIRSRPRAGGEAWELALGGDLATAVRRTPEMAPGTAVVLERGGGDGAVARRVRDAAWQNARFLTRKGERGQPLQVRVNGELQNAPFELPPPSSAFRRGSLRGVVGLGSAARVELFSRGLRVRSAASLDDFVSARGRHSDRSRVHFAEIPGRLAPQAILESDHLELMLSRADARENRSLRRLVGLAQRELARLVDRQLDAARPLPFWQRWALALRLRLRASLFLRTAVAAAVGAGLAVVISLALWGDRLGERLWGAGRAGAGAGAGAGGVAGAPAEAGALRVAGPAVGPSRVGPYGDLAGLYRGPQVDTLEGGSDAATDLTYEPGEGRPHFTALIIERFDASGVPVTSMPRGALSPYVGPRCGGEGCLEVQVTIAAREGLVRIPVPTGHRLDPASLRLDERPRRVFASLHDEPLLVVERPIEGALRYTTVPAAPSHRSWTPAGAEALPEELRAFARGLRRRPHAERVQRLVEEVGRRVRYSVEPEVAAAHREARRAGDNLFARTLAIGRGDCDVQNALLVALLQEAGVEARLAIGYVGFGGDVSPWLHAWAEHRRGDGPWEVADASAAQGPIALAAPPTSGPTALAADETASGGGPSSPAGDTGAEVDPASSGAEVAARAGDDATSAPTETDESRRTLGVLGILLGVVGVGVVGVGVQRRVRREVVLEGSQDLSRLLQGVLQHPDAFRGMPAVFQRPLVPLARGAAISLDDARDLARAGRLFRTRARAPLAAEAIAAGTAVLDEGVADARVVADALGAIDLDGWDALLAAAVPSPLVAAVNAHLDAIGEPWHLLVARDLGKRARTLDMTLLRLRGHPLRGRRVLVVDAADPWLRDAADALGRAPAAARFAALDAIADHLDLAPEQRARLLAGAARDALKEAAS